MKQSLSSWRVLLEVINDGSGIVLSLPILHTWLPLARTIMLDFGSYIARRSFASTTVIIEVSRDTVACTATANRYRTRLCCFERL